MAKDLDTNVTKTPTKKRSVGKGLGLAAGSAAGLAAIANGTEAEAQAVPNGFVQIDPSQFNVTVTGNQATIVSSAGTTTVVPAAQVTIAANGAVFVAPAVAQTLGIAAGVAGVGIGAIAAGAGGLAIAAGAGGGGDDAPATPTNSAPTVANAPENVENALGEAVSITIPANTFTDADGDTITYSALLSDGRDLSAVGLSFDAGTGEISGTFLSDQDITIQITATDSNGASSSTTFDVTAPAATGAAPIVDTNTNANDQTLTVGDAFTATVTFTDPDGDTVSTSAVFYPDAGGLSYNDTTGEITGTIFRNRGHYRHDLRL